MKDNLSMFERYKTTIQNTKQELRNSFHLEFVEFFVKYPLLNSINLYFHSYENSWDAEDVINTQVNDYLSYIVYDGNMFTGEDIIENDNYPEDIDDGFYKMVDCSDIVAEIFPVNILICITQSTTTIKKLDL